MCLRSKILLLLFSIATLSLRAQFIDSIKSEIRNKPKLDARLDTRNSFISNQRAQMTGVKFGLTFGRTFSTGIGYHYIGDLLFDASKSKITETPFKIDIAQLKLQYIAIYAEYEFYSTKKWEFSIPVQLGVGRAFYQYFDSKEIINKSPVFIYEPSMNGTYKLIDWFGVGANVGYRIMFKNNTLISQRFTSPIYVLTTSLYFGVLYQKAIKLLKKDNKSLL